MGAKNSERIVKSSGEIVSPLNMISNSVKRVGVLGNYCQILLRVCTPIKKKQKEIGQLSAEDFDLRKSLISFLAENSDHYIDLKPRDLCDIAKLLALIK